MHRYHNTEALQLHTTLTFEGLKARQRAAASSRVPAWLLPPPQRKVLVLGRPRTTLSLGSKRQFEEPQDDDDNYNTGVNDDVPLDFLEALKEHNLPQDKRTRKELESLWGADASPVDRPEINREPPKRTTPADNKWFEDTLQQIKDRYEGIRSQVKSELAETREADPDSVPDTAEGMMDSVLRQQMEMDIKETRSQMEMDRYLQMESDQRNMVDNLDMTSIGPDKTVNDLIKQSEKEISRRSRSQAEIDDFLKYQQERRAEAADGEFVSNIEPPTDDLDAWALERMEDMLANNANNEALKASIGDLRSRIKSAKNDKSFKADSYEDWQMYRKITQSMSTSSNDGLAAFSEEDVLGKLLAWKEYIASEQIYREQAGMTPKVKMPFNWNQASPQEPSKSELKSMEDEKKDPDAYRAEMNREALRVMENLLDKQGGAARNGALAKRIESLKATLESTNYVDRRFLTEKKKKTPAGPVDVSDIFGSKSKDVPKVKKQRPKEEFSKFPNPEKKRNRITEESSDEEDEWRKPDIIDYDLIEDREPIKAQGKDLSSEEPAKRPNSPFFNLPDTDEPEMEKKISPPKTPFFEPVDRSNEKLGSIEEQKLRNMYRQAGARSDEEQAKIKKGWDDFKAYEAAQRDLSGLSLNDLSANLTARSDLGYNLSDVIKEDGDVDSDTILAAIRARRPKPRASSADSTVVSTSGTTNLQTSLQKSEFIADDVVPSFDISGDKKEKSTPGFPPPPKTPFFEPVDRSNEKLGSIEEQKLRNMYRQAGARSDEEQAKIKKGWDDFKAYEAAQRDLSGLSFNDLSSNLTARSDLGYNISDVIKEDGDVDSDTILAAIRARRPKPRVSSEDIFKDNLTGGTPSMLTGELIAGDVAPSFDFSGNPQEGSTSDSVPPSETDAGPVLMSQMDNPVPISDQVVDDGIKSAESMSTVQIEESPESISGEQETLSGTSKFASSKFRKPVRFESLFEEFDDSGVRTEKLLTVSEISIEKSDSDKRATFDSQSGEVNNTPFIESLIEGIEALKPGNEEGVGDKAVVESAELSMEDFGFHTPPPSPVIEQSLTMGEEVESRFAKRSFVKPPQDIIKQQDDYDAMLPARPSSGQGLGGFLGDEAFDDTPTPIRSNPDDFLRRKEEFESLRAAQTTKRIGLDLSDVLGSRDRDDGFKQNSMEEYLFPVRNKNADLSSFLNRKAALMDRTLVNVLDVYNLMDLKDSLEGDGLSRYVPQIKKPFSEFGALFRLEGVLIDVTGLHYKAWKIVAEKHNFDPPVLDDVRLATVAKPASAVERIFYWSNDNDECLEAAKTHSNAIRDLVTDWVKKNEKKVLVATPSSQEGGNSAQSIGDDMLNPKRVLKPGKVLTDSELQQIHFQAWGQIAVERGLKPPSFEDAVASIAINNPSFIIREWFKWSTEDYVIEEISQAYRNMVLKVVSAKTGVKVDAPGKKTRRGFLPAMGDQSSWRKVKQESVEEVEANAKKEHMIIVAKESWLILARNLGLPEPDTAKISQAMKVGPDEAVMTVFGWTKSRTEMNDVVRQYHNIFNENLESENANQRMTPKASEIDLPLVEIMPGAAQWISSLVSVEMSCGILSVMERDVVDMLLRQSGFSNLIDPGKRLTASDMYTRNDQELLQAAIRLERRPDHCIIFDPTSQTCVAAREVEMKSVGMTGIYPSYELVAADSTVRDFDSLTAINIRRLFAEVENQEPMLLSEVARPVKKRKVKTRFVDQNDREWDSDDYYEKYGNYGEESASEDLKKYDDLEDTFEKGEAPSDDEGGISFNDSFRDWLFQ